MNIKDIKVGETYNVRMKVSGICEGLIYMESDIPNGYDYAFYEPELAAFSHITPKYDPCRKFKKGDNVRMVEWRGRLPYDSENGNKYTPNGAVFTVEHDEFENGEVSIYAQDSFDAFSVHYSNLELVTPVKELEPYVVRLAKTDGVEEWHVEPRNNTLALVAVFGHRHPHAKAAAEAERDRLNAEYRKENGHA